MTTVADFAAQAKRGPLPPWLPVNGSGGVAVTALDATVVAVTVDSIEVQIAGGDKSVTYQAHCLLVSGAVCHWEWDSHCYLLDDLQKGDEVILGVGKADAADKTRGQECFYMTIRRRPGGEIPPSRKPSKTHPYHVSRQREVDYEDRGEYTPERLKAYELVKSLNEKDGLPPPPPLPKLMPRVKADVKSDGKK